MSISRSSFISILVLLFSPPQIFAHPVINEIYPVGTDDWVEIYNPPSEPSVDLSKYTLRDSSKTNKIILSGTIPPGGHSVFAFGNKLNNGGDTVKLLQNSDSTVVNELSYGKGTDCVVAENQSVGKNTQGSVVVFSNPSKGQQNSEGASCLKAKPTEEPVIVTPSPPKNVQSVEVEESTIDAPVVKAAVTEDLSEPTSSPSLMPTTRTLISGTETPAVAPTSPTIGNAVVGLGMICIFIAVAGFLRVIKKRYNEKHAQDSR